MRNFLQYIRLSGSLGREEGGLGKGAASAGKGLILMGIGGLAGRVFGRMGGTVAWGCCCSRGAGSTSPSGGAEEGGGADLAVHLVDIETAG